jgi:hypothetical protein
MGMPYPLKQKQERSREDEGATSSSKRPKHHKTPSMDHFDAINLTTPKSMFEDVSTQKHHNVQIDTIDLTQSDPEPGMKANLLYCMTPLNTSIVTERRYRLDVSDGGNLIEFITDSEGEL